MPLGCGVWVVLEAQIDFIWKTSWSPFTKYLSFQVLDSMYDLIFLLLSDI